MSAIQDPHEKDITWLLYCCCEGFGLGPVGSPCAQAQGKCCCFTGTVEYDFTSDIMGGGGLCFSGGKCCCCVQAMQFPPKKLFIEIVGMRLVGGPKPGAAAFGNKSELEMVTVDSEIEVLNRELQEAIAAEDFIRAAGIKADRDQFQARLTAEAMGSEVPSKLSM